MVEKREKLEKIQANLKLSPEKIHVYAQRKLNIDHLQRTLYKLEWGRKIHFEAFGFAIDTLQRNLQVFELLELGELSHYDLKRGVRLSCVLTPNKRLAYYEKLTESLNRC